MWYHVPKIVWLLLLMTLGGCELSAIAWYGKSLKGRTNEEDDEERQEGQYVRSHG
jgi:hypothetical protein